MWTGSSAEGLNLMLFLTSLLENSIVKLKLDEQ
jgi:hypothetical protein